MSVMSQLDLARQTTQTTRCGSCGTKERPARTVVVDWRTDLLCDACVANHDWSDWRFDPVLNVYYRR